MSKKKGNSKKQDNSWMYALQEYNSAHQGGGDYDITHKRTVGKAWCVPRKGTPDYKAVRNIQKYDINKSKNPLSEKDKNLFKSHKERVRFNLEGDVAGGGKGDAVIKMMNHFKKIQMLSHSTFFDALKK